MCSVALDPHTIAMQCVFATRGERVSVHFPSLSCRLTVCLSVRVEYRNGEECRQFSPLSLSIISKHTGNRNSRMHQQHIIFALPVLSVHRERHVPESLTHDRREREPIREQAAGSKYKKDEGIEVSARSTRQEKQIQCLV